ncbi:MAG: helix-turn-helix domain-containing protein [Alphaproteobacteria bacterium]|nr:helix-turn-helix domain-containing protein [Alphaproteobacteria bacterium]
MTLGDLIREARTKTGKSIKDFAPDVGIHPNTLGMYERGESTPDVDFLARLSAVTGEPLFPLLWQRLKDTDDAKALAAFELMGGTLSAAQAERAAAGRGANSVDHGVLVNAIGMLEGHLSKVGRTMTPERKALWIAHLYAELLEPPAGGQAKADSAARLLELLDALE